MSDKLEERAREIAMETRCKSCFNIDGAILYCQKESGHEGLHEFCGDWEWSDSSVVEEECGSHAAAERPLEGEWYSGPHGKPLKIVRPVMAGEQPVVPVNSDVALAHTAFATLKAHGLASGPSQPETEQPSAAHDAQVRRDTSNRNCHGLRRVERRAPKLLSRRTFARIMPSSPPLPARARFQGQPVPRRMVMPNVKVNPVPKFVEGRWQCPDGYTFITPLYWWTAVEFLATCDGISIMSAPTTPGTVSEGS